LTDEPEAPGAPAPTWEPFEPFGSTPPPPPEPGPPRRHLRWWQWSLASLLVLLVAGALLGFWVQLPYGTISPGGSLPVESAISVRGARTYPANGSIRLLYVRERVPINFWRWVQAKLDNQIDLERKKNLTGGQSSDFNNAQAVAQMSEAQNDAKKVALEAVGYKVPLATQGVVVLSVFAHAPAAGVLEKGDVIVSVDGKTITAQSDLGNEIRKQKVGAAVTLGVRRDGKLHTFTLHTQADPQTHKPMIGVFASAQYKYPVSISINTADIGGPSAGLAMTLALIDELTPGNLTGGQQVAVTGTIDPNGVVGEIGGIEQKAVAAHAFHAKLFIVPKCVDTDAKLRAGCLADLARAKKRVGDMPVVPVANLSQALAALRKIGGEPFAKVHTAA
jgi:Lon-like protease